jgi:hypothetical protein
VTPTTVPKALPTRDDCRQIHRATEPQSGLTDDGDDDRLLNGLAQDPMKLSPKDGESCPRTMVASAHRANEDGRSVDARRNKLLASRRSQPELGQLIAWAGGSRAHRHATTV